MQLPAEIRQILDQTVHRTPMAGLAKAAALISERYRRADQNRAIASAEEACAYAAVRLPATYCAAMRAMDALHAALPGFDPASLLDVGAGPATVTLAALERFPSLETVRLVEPNIHLRGVGKELMVALHPALSFEWLAESIDRSPATASFDLVATGYVLNEITVAQNIAATVKKLWGMTGHTLLIIEPGTPLGQNIVLQARDILLKEGAYIAAPCPHASACPVAALGKTEEKWCHFSVRVERSRLHRQIKPDASLSYEDEKFSYLVATRDIPKTPQARLIGHPRGKQLISAELCLATGKYQSVQIPKSHPDHKIIKKAGWGDGIWS